MWDFKKEDPVPVRDAGILHEPPVSLQKLPGAPLAATIAAEPPLLPVT